VATFADLLLLLRADSTDLDAKLDSSIKAIQDLGDKASEFGKRLTEGLTLSAIAKDVFDAGQTVEDAMSQIERATGAVGDPLRGLQDSFAATFGNVVQGAGDVAGALAILSQRSGATGDDLNSLLEINSKFAQVLDQQLRPTVEATQKIFTGFGVTVDEQPAKLDALLAIIQKSGATFPTLASNLTTLGPTLRAMGLDLTDSAALLANFETHGENVSRVAATLNSSLVTLAKEGFTDPKAALGEFLQQIIEAKDPTEALQLAAENFKGKGLVPLVDALQGGVGNLAALKDAAANSKGKIDETADSTQTLGEKFTLLEGATTKLLAPIGVDMVAALAKLVDAGTGTVKFIDAITQKADELDKKFGTDTEHITGFAELFDIMAKAIAEKAIPGLKSLSDEASNNKFVDGTMANGLKTISDMFPNFGKNIGDAQDKFADLDKELKAAENNLADVEKSVRMGVGTDDDAAAAKAKVVAALQALHPEYKSVFAETSDWDSALQTSKDLIGQQADELLKAAPIISAHTALLEAQAISLQSRAGLWPRDMEGIQEQAAALTQSTEALSPNIAGMKDLDAVIKLSQTGLADQLKGIQAVTQGFGPLHDAQLLGINDGSVLKTRMDDMHDAFLRATSAVDGQGNSIYSLHQQEIAQIADLQSTIAYYQSLGVNTDALQLKAMHLSDAIHTQNEGFLATVVAMRGIITSGLDTALDNLITGAGNVTDAFKKMGEGLVTTFANRILNDALKPVENELDSLIDKALSATESLLKISSGGVATLADDPGAGVSIATGASDLINQVHDIGAAGTGQVGDIVKTGDTLAGVGKAANAGASGGATSAISSTLSSVTGIVGAVGSVVSAISGIIGNFQMAHQETSLNAIESNTRVGALYTLALLQEFQGFRDFYNYALFPELKGILDWQGYIVNSVNDLSAAMIDDLPSKIGAFLAPSTQLINDTHDILVNAMELMSFNWEQLAPDLASIQRKLDSLIQAVSGLKVGGVSAITANPGVQPLQIKSSVYLDSQELFQSFVTWMDQTGKVLPSF
jgi:hypothetical protein